MEHAEAGAGVSARRTRTRAATTKPPRGGRRKRVSRRCSFRLRLVGRRTGVPRNRFRRSGKEPGHRVGTIGNETEEGHRQKESPPARERRRRQIRDRRQHDSRRRDRKKRPVGREQRRNERRSGGLAAADLGVAVIAGHRAARALRRRAEGRARLAGIASAARSRNPQNRRTSGILASRAAPDPPFQDRFILGAASTPCLRGRTRRPPDGASPPGSRASRRGAGPGG